MMNNSNTARVSAEGLVPASHDSDSGVRVLAVASGKGGVGKTNISVNLALALAQEGEAVLLMDADLGMANIDVMLNIRPQFDLYHVITGEKTLDEVIIEGPLGIGIIPAASGVGRMADLSVMEHAGLIRAFDEISRKVDTLVVDTAAGISDSVVSFSRAAQEVIVVVCDEPASITDAYALIKVLSIEHGVRRFQILANMVTDAEHGRRLYARLANVAGSFLDVSLGFVGSIPLDERLKQAVRAQVPLLLAHPHSASGVAFQVLGKRVKVLPRLPAASGHLGFFLERTSKTPAMAGGARS
jgi:flagellar biosynthesis protein FlhG